MPVLRRGVSLETDETERLAFRRFKSYENDHVVPQRQDNMERLPEVSEESPNVSGKTELLERFLSEAQAERRALQSKIEAERLDAQMRLDKVQDEKRELQVKIEAEGQKAQTQFEETSQKYKKMKRKYRKTKAKLQDVETTLKDAQIQLGTLVLQNRDDRRDLQAELQETQTQCREAQAKATQAGQYFQQTLVQCLGSRPGPISIPETTRVGVSSTKVSLGAYGKILGLGEAGLSGTYKHTSPKLPNHPVQDNPTA